jgi:hypothetical protein
MQLSKREFCSRSGRAFGIAIAFELRGSQDYDRDSEADSAFNFLYPVTMTGSSLRNAQSIYQEGNNCLIVLRAHIII